MNVTKTIFITGGAGFIGANLVHELVRQGLDNLHVLVEKNTDTWRLTNVLSSLVIHEIDLTHFDAVQKLVDTIKPTLVFHLASFGGMPNQIDQKKIYDVNLYGTINLLNACKKNGFECFINTGSSSEYGMKNEPMEESMVLEPVSDYGVAKAAATQFCLKEATFNKLPVYTIRPFSVYGDYEMPTRLIPTILVNTLLGKSITLSSPHFVRDFIYIKDVITLYCDLAHYRPSNAFVFNCGTGVQSSIQDVITTMQHLWPTQLSVQWGQRVPRLWEPAAWQANNIQAKKVLGWEPNYALHEGLATSLSWFQEHLSLYLKGDAYEHLHAKTTCTNYTCNK